MASVMIKRRRMGQILMIQILMMIKLKTEMKKRTEQILMILTQMAMV